MDVLDNVATSNGYTAAATIENVYGASGIAYLVGNANAYMQVQRGDKGKSAWSQDIPISPSSGTIGPPAIGVRFRSYTAGTPARVFAIAAGPQDPAVSGTQFTGTILTSGQVLPFVSIIDLALLQANVVISAVGDATANVIVTGASVTYDGVTRVRVDFFAPDVTGPNVANEAVTFNLYQDGADIGRIGTLRSGGINEAAGHAPVASTIFTPTAGAHTYSIRGWRGTTNWTIVAGAGGAGVARPGYLLISNVT